MKRLLSMICCIAMMLTVCAMPALAAETTPVPIAQTYEVENAIDGGVSTRATSQGLYYKENAYLAGSPTSAEGLQFEVTPEKGANLRIWLKVESGTAYGPMKVTVSEKNFLGIYSTVYTGTFNTGTDTDVLTRSNCNGRSYRIMLQATDLASKYSILVYQN